MRAAQFCLGGLPPMQLHYLEIVCTDVDAACSASAAFARILVMAAAFATDWGSPRGEPLELVLDKRLLHRPLLRRCLAVPALGQAGRTHHGIAEPV